MRHVKANARSVFLSTLTIQVYLAEGSIDMSHCEFTLINAFLQSMIHSRSSSERVHQEMTSLPIPKQPLDILLPFPPAISHTPLSFSTAKSLLKHLESTEAYSVTFSPILCPEGKNHLFTLKPYYWKVAPNPWGR